tara:strand:+ start:10739 stop:13705 length:2967 start_codon:yes stop_codon:yes gene_type:complete
MIDKSIGSQINAMVEKADTTGLANDFDQSEQPVQADSVFTGESENVAGLRSLAVKGAKALKPSKSSSKALSRKARETIGKTTPPTPAQEVQEAASAIEVSGVGTLEEGKKAARVQQKVNAEPTVTPEELTATIEKNVQKIEETKTTAQAAGKEPVDLKPPKEQFNLPLISDSTDFQSTVKSIAEAAGIKTDNITFEQVIESAKQAGADESFINKLITGKLEVDPVNTYRAFEVQKSSADHLTDTLRKLNDNPSKVTPEMELEAIQTIAFHSALQRQIKGYQTNVAQSMAVMRIPRTGFIDLEEATGGLMNSSDLRKFAAAYMDDSLDAAARSKLIDAAATSGLKDKFMTVFINGILSRPSTHIKNIYSNAMMPAIRMVESAGAAAIGTARRGLGLGLDEQYYFTENVSKLTASVQAVKDGFKMASHAFKEGYSSNVTDTTKIEFTKARYEIFDYKADNPLASILKSVNYVATLPGRSLLVADEFFKGINYRFELEGLATRNGINAMNDGLKAGKSSDEASKLFDDAIDNTYNNPPKDLTTLSQEATFTKPMEEGLVKTLQTSLNADHPISFLAKLNIPFTSTPVNLQLQVLQRTPLAFLSKKIRAEIARGSKEGDLALAKVGLGTGFGMAMANYANDGKVTGGGPADKAQRDALLRQGWQPYSITLDFGDSEIDEISKQGLNDIPGDKRYGTGDLSGKVYISYQGIEPIGAFLAMASNYTEYARYSDDEDGVKEMAAALSYGFYDYVMTNPFIEGISNIMSIIDGRHGSSQDKASDAIKQLGKIFVETGSKMVTPLSGMISSGREKLDPYRRDYKSDATEDSAVNGMIEGMNSARNNTPGLSDELPLKLNIWGEPTKYQYTWLPMRVSEGTNNKADSLVIRTGTKLGMPSRTISFTVAKDLTGSTKLTAPEYNKMLEIANDPAGYNLQGEIAKLEDDIQSLPLYRQQSVIKSVSENVFEKVRKQMLVEYPQIMTRINEDADIIREKGN